MLFTTVLFNHLAKPCLKNTITLVAFVRVNNTHGPSPHIKNAGSQHAAINHKAPFRLDAEVSIFAVDG